MPWYSLLSGLYLKPSRGGVWQRQSFASPGTASSVAQKGTGTKVGGDLHFWGARSRVSGRKFGVQGVGCAQRMFAPFWACMRT